MLAICLSSTAIVPTPPCLPFHISICFARPHSHIYIPEAVYLYHKGSPRHCLPPHTMSWSLFFSCSSGHRNLLLCNLNSTCHKYIGARHRKDHSSFVASSFAARASSVRRLQHGSSARPKPLLIRGTVRKDNFGSDRILLPRICSLRQQEQSKLAPDVSRQILAPISLEYGVVKSSK